VGICSCFYPFYPADFIGLNRGIGILEAVSEKERSVNSDQGGKWIPKDQFQFSGSRTNGWTGILQYNWKIQDSPFSSPFLFMWIIPTAGCYSAFAMYGIIWRYLSFMVMRGPFKNISDALSRYPNWKDFLDICQSSGNIWEIPGKREKKSCEKLTWKRWQIESIKLQTYPWDSGDSSKPYTYSELLKYNTEYTIFCRLIRSRKKSDRKCLDFKRTTRAGSPKAPIEKWRRKMI